MSTDRTIANLEMLLEPIGGTNPSGEDLRDGLTYHEVEQARHADDIFERGDVWQREIKVAEWARVKKLTTETLANRSKDLKIAAWLLEALAWSYSFAGVRDGVYLMRELLQRFWDTLYPEIDEDGDLDSRAGPLVWISSKLPPIMRQLDLTKTNSGLDYSLLQKQRAQQFDNLKNQDPDAYKQLSEEDKKLGESLTRAVANTTREFYETQLLHLQSCLQELEQLDEVVDEKFGNEAPGFTEIRKELNECLDFVESALRQKPKPAPKKVEPAAETAETQVAQTARDQHASQSPDDKGAQETGTAIMPEVDTAEMAQTTSAAPAEKQQTASETESIEKKRTVELSPPPEQPENGAEQASSTTPASPPVGAPANTDEALRQILVAAGALRTKNPTSPVPYLVLRAVRWGEVRAKGATLQPDDLAAPSKETRQKLEQLHDESKMKELLQLSEELMAKEEGRGWLDLQYYTYKALARQGSSYQNARKALCSELQAYLAEFDDLPHRELSDGTQAANATTRQWLKSEVLTRHPANAGGDENGQTQGAGGISDELWQQASAKVKAGQFSEGVVLLQQEVSKCRSERNRFLGKLRIAELCLQSQKATLARPILNELKQSIETFHLEAWEQKEISVRVWQAFVRCFRSLQNLTPAEQEQLDSAFDKLCQLDIEQALALSEEK
ncbi:MAG: type VI secretion system protein TssA [bacterium]